MRIDRAFSYSVLIIFAGSVFFTSGKFVNTTNTPKFYFAAVFLPVLIMMLIFIRRINFISLFKNKTLLYGIFVVNFIQACYGFCQFWSLFSGWIAGAIYVLVALIWLIPDKRIEMVFEEEYFEKD